MISDPYPLLKKLSQIEPLHLAVFHVWRFQNYGISKTVVKQKTLKNILQYLLGKHVKKGVISYMEAL